MNELGERFNTVGSIPLGNEGQVILPESASSGCGSTRTHKHRRRPGPKRKNWVPNPYGRYPATSSVNKYIDGTNHYYALSTQKERRRKLHYIIRIFRQLGLPTNPCHIQQEHVLTFIDYLEKKGLQGTSRKKLIRFLSDYLIHNNNDIISKMRARKIFKMPSETNKEVRHLPPDVIDLIHNTTKTIEGWPGAVAQFITMVYPYTGLRPSELRMMEYRDVDLANWRMMVRHPKGEQSYGRQRTVGISSLLKEVFANYIEERREYLKSNGLSETSIPLIPNVTDGTAKFWTAGMLNQLKRRIERMAGIPFQTKDYRSSFCQIAIDKGANVEAISKVMGHQSTMTTEHYYGRMRDEPAIAEVERALMKPNVMQNQKVVYT